MSLTLEQYSKAKRLPIDFLKEIGAEQTTLRGKPAVRMPYWDLEGKISAKRLRLSMDEDPRFVWEAKPKVCLYGLWNLDDTVEFIILDEGESDCQTHWLNGFPALGLPGANMWKEEWATYFDRFRRVYVVVEPDRGGEAVLRRLGKSKIADRVRLIRLDGAKDPSELYLEDPKNFTKNFKAAMKAAVPWSETEEKKRTAKTDSG